MRLLIHLIQQHHQQHHHHHHHQQQQQQQQQHQHQQQQQQQQQQRQQLHILHQAPGYKDSVRHLNGRNHRHTPIVVDVDDQVIHGLVVMQVIMLMDIVFISKNVFIGNSQRK